jgi:hypothetical protein
MQNPTTRPDMNFGLLFEVAYLPVSWLTTVLSLVSRTLFQSSSLELAISLVSMKSGPTTTTREFVALSIFWSTSFLSAAVVYHRHFRSRFPASHLSTLPMHIC